MPSSPLLPLRKSNSNWERHTSTRPWVKPEWDRSKRFGLALLSSALDLSRSGSVRRTQQTLTYRATLAAYLLPRFNEHAKRGTSKLNATLLTQEAATEHQAVD